MLIAVTNGVRVSAGQGVFFKSDSHTSRKKRILCVTLEKN